MGNTKKGVIFTNKNKLKATTYLLTLLNIEILKKKGMKTMYSQ